MTDVEIPRTREDFRRFVLRHHPDRGGDPDTFAAGVAAFRQQSRSASPIVFYRKRTVLAQLLDKLRTLLRAPGPGGRVSEKRARP